MIVRSHSKHMPVRTCVGCRQKAPQEQLLRVALVDGTPVADERRRLPGRGGYVHRAGSCAERALSRGGLARAFRTRLAPQAVNEGAKTLVELASRGEDSSRGASI